MSDKEFYIAFGQNLRHFRNDRGWSAEYVADQIGISSDSVLKYEKGQRKMNARMLLKAAVLLNTSILSLFAGLDPRRPDDPAGAELSMLPPDLGSIMRYLSTEWDGNIEALIIADYVYSMLPASSRREIIMALTIELEKAVSEGSISPNKVPERYGYLINSLGALYDL